MSFDPITLALCKGSNTGSVGIDFLAFTTTLELNEEDPTIAKVTALSEAESDYFDSHVPLIPIYARIKTVIGDVTGYFNYVPGDGSYHCFVFNTSITEAAIFKIRRPNLYEHAGRWYAEFRLESSVATE